MGVQRLIVNAEDDKVVQIAPPILGRIYSDLASGMVNLAKARRISEFHFPFPYAQTLTALLLLVTLLQPLMAATFIESSLWAGILSFMGIFTLWSINYVAHEIERPYGDGYNDLPLVEMQLNFNVSLMSLLEKEAMQPPIFSLDEAKNQTVVVGDGMIAEDIQDILPVLRNNTRLGTMPADTKRSDTLPTRRQSMAMRDSGDGTSKSRRTVKLATFQEEAGGDQRVLAAQPGVEGGGAAGDYQKAAPPKLIRKLEP